MSDSAETLPSLVNCVKTLEDKGMAVGFVLGFQGLAFDWSNVMSIAPEVLKFLVCF